jgi:spore maturation protein CgeB
VHIGLIGSPRPDMFQDNIGESLVRSGHRVSYLGSTVLRRGGPQAARVAELLITASRGVEARLHCRLARRAMDLACDAVISTEGDLSPDAVAALRRVPIPVALWFPDHVGNMRRQRMLAAPYDAMFFKDPVLVRRLRDTLGLPVWYLPEACNPRWHRPVGEPGTGRHIAVVGNLYLSRLMLLRRLHDAGIPLAIYSAGAPRWARHLLPPGLHVRPAVFREDKSQVFRGSAGVLNNLHPAEIHGVNARLFEASGAGGAVLCERRPALGDLFDLEREVLPFTDFSELVDHARSLLADPALGREVGDAASRRAHADHTYEDRLPAILEKLA